MKKIEEYTPGELATLSTEWWLFNIKTMWFSN
jgi:hypothetical protein